LPFILVETALNLIHYNNFLFDLDGTLVDSFGDIKLSLENSYQAVLQKRVTLSRSLIGPPLNEMIENLTPELTMESKQAIVKEFRNHYDNSTYELTNEMEGAADFLTTLFDQGKQLFVVTNKSYTPTLRILKKLGLNMFKDVVSPDKFEGEHYTKAELIKYLIKTYFLDLRKTVMLGDTRHDIISARANSIDSISISSGYDHFENLKKEKPTYIVDNIIQLQSKLS
jgi:phosphoglycolate phosphatase